MSIKPLNLSIVVGDMNRTPPVTPRRGDFHILTSSKSIKNRPITPCPSGNVSMKPNLRFRQWPDPPPPPTRSRTTERKQVTNKRRPGSVDSRFRRTITDDLKIDLPSDKMKTIQDIRAEFLSNPLSIEHLTEKPKENEQCSNNYKAQCTENLKDENIINISSAIIPDRKSENKISSDTAHMKYDLGHESNLLEYIEGQTDGYKSPSEIFNNHKTSHENKLKSKPCEILKDDFLPEFDTNDFVCPQFENQIELIHEYSQTDISIAVTQSPGSTIINSELIREDEDFQDNLSNNISTKSKADSLILNRTRSIGNSISQNNSQEILPVLDKINECLTSPANRKQRFNRYLQIWTIIVFSILLGIMSWMYLYPYLKKLYWNIYFTYINPKPIETPNFMVQLFNNFCSSMGNLLSQPTLNRIKNL